MSKGWNDLMLKKLKALMGKGLSTAEMGKKLGLSKNAVVGKLNRLGWNAKATDSKPAKKTAKPAKAPAKSAKATSTAKVVTKKTTKVATKPTKTPVKAKPITKTTEKKATAKKATAKPVAKKAVVAKPAKKAPVAKKETKKPAVKPVAKVPVVKTASKKTKKDLASHELYIEHAKKMAELKPNQCRWPIGDPDSNNFRFCGEPVFPGKPYCYEHCRQAYQFTPVKKK